MNFKYLLLLTLVAVPALAIKEKAAMAVENEEFPMVVNAEQCNPGLADEECPAVPVPCMEKVGTKCKVDHCMPSQCFKVIKHITREDLYKIPGTNRHECTLCDENGCRPCCGEKLGCGCAPKCERPCKRECKPRCERRCERRCTRRCDRCEK